MCSTQTELCCFFLIFFFSFSSTVFAGYRSGYEWWESIIMFRKCCFVMLSIFLGVYGATPQVSCCKLKSIPFVVVHNVLQLKFCLTHLPQSNILFLILFSPGRCVVHGFVGCSFTAVAVPTILTRRAQSVGKYWTAHMFVTTTGGVAVQCGGKN